MADSTKFSKLKTNIKSAVDGDPTGSLKAISNRLGDGMVTLSIASLINLVALKSFKLVLKNNFIDFPGASVLSTSKSVLDKLQSPMNRLGVDEKSQEASKVNKAIRKIRDRLTSGDDKSKSDSAKSESTTEDIEKEEEQNNKMKELGEFLQSL